MVHTIICVLIALSAVVVLLGHIPIYGRPRVRVVDGFAGATDASGAVAAAKAAPKFKAGCTVKDAEGKEHTCTSPGDDDNADCASCKEGFTGGVTVPAGVIADRPIDFPKPVSFPTAPEPMDVQSVGAPVTQAY